MKLGTQYLAERLKWIRSNVHVHLSHCFTIKKNSSAAPLLLSLVRTSKTKVQSRTRTPVPFYTQHHYFHMSAYCFDQLDKA